MTDAEKVVKALKKSITCVPVSDCYDCSRAKALADFVLAAMPCRLGDNCDRDGWSDPGSEYNIAFDAALARLREVME